MSPAKQGQAKAWHEQVKLHRKALISSCHRSKATYHVFTTKVKPCLHLARYGLVVLSTSSSTCDTTGREVPQVEFLMPYGAPGVKHFLNLLRNNARLVIHTSVDSKVLPANGTFGHASKFSESEYRERGEAVFDGPSSITTSSLQAWVAVKEGPIVICRIGWSADRTERHGSQERLANGGKETDLYQILEKYAKDANLQKQRLSLREMLSSAKIVLYASIYEDTHLPFLS
jgi:hypothetical protein